MQKGPHFEAVEKDINLESLLYPESHLADVDLDKLKITVLDSGFSTFNEYGLLKEDRSEIVIVAARPSMGKSALMFQVAMNMAKDKKPIYIFSLEMDKASVFTRMMSQIIELPSQDITEGKVERELLEFGKKELLKRPMYINDTAGLDMHSIINHAKDAKQRLGIELFVIDYLQLIRKEHGHSTNAEVGLISLQLKQLARELKTPIIVGSQLSRANETRANKEPVLSDLRDSGAIEQDADMVLLLHRPSVYDQNFEDKRLAKVNIAKNRNGPTGWVNLKFFGERCQFTEEYDTNLF